MKRNGLSSKLLIDFRMRYKVMRGALEIVAKFVGPAHTNVGSLFLLAKHGILDKKFWTLYHHVNRLALLSPHPI
jgi:hypothetical protein